MNRKRRLPQCIAHHLVPLPARQVAGQRRYVVAHFAFGEALDGGADGVQGGEARDASLHGGATDVEAVL